MCNDCTVQTADKEGAMSADQLQLVIRCQCLQVRYVALLQTASGTVIRNASTMNTLHDWECALLQTAR